MKTITKVFLLVTLPIWGIGYIFYIIGKDVWNSISNFVERIDEDF